MDRTGRAGRVCHDPFSHFPITGSSCSSAAQLIGHGSVLGVHLAVILFTETGKNHNLCLQKQSDAEISKSFCGSRGEGAMALMSNAMW